MWIRRLVVSLLLLIGLPLLGIPAGFALLDAWKSADSGSWEGLGRPAQEPVAIVDADLDDLYVRAQDGTRYHCSIADRTRDHGCWQEVDAVGKLNRDERRNDNYRQEIPPPPGPVLELVHVSWYHAERARHTRYALLEDGTVWLWDYYPDANWSLVLLACGPACGLGLAVFIVAMWWGAAGLRALWRRVQARSES